MLVARLSSLLSSIGKLVRRGREGSALRQLCWAATNIRISHVKWLK